MKGKLVDIKSCWYSNTTIALLWFTSFSLDQFPLAFSKEISNPASGTFHLKSFKLAPGNKDSFSREGNKTHVNSHLIQIFPPSWKSYSGDGKLSELEAKNSGKFSLFLCVCLEFLQVDYLIK